MPFTPIRVLTLDLDDTLWPIGPVIARAEQAQRAWLEQHAPATAAQFDLAALRRLRAEVERDHPEWHHDLTALRRGTLRRAVRLAGEPEALADQAFEAFFAARQQVDFFPDALPALHRLAARFPLWSLSNGNADLARVGLDHLFQGAISASQVGVAKPDPRVFAHACQRIGQPAEAVLHVGDDLHMDVLGARDAGLHAAWVRRAAVPPPAVGQPARSPDAQVHIVTHLHELADRLGC